MKDKKIETPEEKLRKENKEIQDTLKKEIKMLRLVARPFLAYKKLILNAAKSDYDFKEVVEGLKFAAKLIKKKDWALLDRVAGTSGDLMARGACSKCEINLVGEDLLPREFTMPCLIKDCPGHLIEARNDINLTKKTDLFMLAAEEGKIELYQKKIKAGTEKNSPIYDYIARKVKTNEKSNHNK